MVSTPPRSILAEWLDEAIVTLHAIILVSGPLLIVKVLIDLDDLQRPIVLRQFVAPLCAASLLLSIAWQIATTHTTGAVWLAVAGPAIIVWDGTAQHVFSVLHAAAVANDDPAFLVLTLFFGACCSAPWLLALAVGSSLRQRKTPHDLPAPAPLEPRDADEAPAAPLTQFETAAAMLRAQARKHDGGPDAARFIRAAAEIETADTVAKLRDILGTQFNDETIKEALRRAGIRVE
ncbi:hypothetical protein KF840_19375 [bacterium]|nr:hypothetical protein [bacterium]